MGNILIPELKESPFLSIKTDNKIYYPNSKIKGIISLTLNVPLEINGIEISLEYLEGWKHLKPKITYLNRDYHIKKKIISVTQLNLQKLLNEKTNKIKFKPGIHNFNFEIPFYKYFNPSFEYRGEQGRIFIRYILKAKLILQNNNNNKSSDIESEIILQVQSKQKVEDKEEKFENKQNIYKWGMIKRGICQIKNYLPKINYKFNDNIPLTIVIDNRICGLSVENLKITFKRNITYINENKTEFSEIKKISSGIYLARVKKGEIKIFKYFYNINNLNNKFILFSGISEPYKEPNIDWQIFTPTIYSDSFKCEYSIKITLYFESFVNYDYRPRVIIPITITHDCSNKYDFVEEISEEVKFNDINLKESYFEDFVVEDYGEKKSNINNKNDINLENIITDDGCGQLFKYYENLKKKKYEEERKKREEEIKKGEEEKNNFFLNHNSINKYLENNDNFTLFLDNDENNNNYIIIPPKSDINNNENFCLFDN